MELTWENLEGAIAACTRCRLCEGRQNVVPGMGNRHAGILFIGEGPGAEEDKQGLPFVGPAGQLLDKMLFSIGLDRTNCYIANVVKCRPPRNRTPMDDEAAACIDYLRAQVKLIKPKVIVLLGATAAKHTLDPNIRITRDRGIWHEKNGYHMIATFHPSYLLRDPSAKRLAWQDLQSIRNKLEELHIDLRPEEPHEP